MGNQRQIQSWLYIGCFLIFIMVMIGGITRLTGSGLSMTDWNLIMGAIPPTSEEAWQEAFDQYKQFPQYKLVNTSMGVEEFKDIYFWEYFHRLWGRLIGIVFIVPFLFFIIKKKFKKDMTNKLIILFALGALQGFVGWFMVKSGLINHPEVSHFRLATHLLLALTLYSYILYMAYDLKKAMHKFQTSSHTKKALWVSNLIILVLIGQIFYGALMAGLKAGPYYPSYPTMNGSWIPPGLTSSRGFLANLFSNKTSVQFIHRLLPLLLGGLIVYFYIIKVKAKKQLFSNSLHNYTIGMISLYLLQFALGVITVINCIGHVPLLWGVAHQACAILLLSACLLVNFRLRRGLER